MAQRKATTMPSRIACAGCQFREISRSRARWLGHFFVRARIFPARFRSVSVARCRSREATSAGGGGRHLARPLFDRTRRHRCQSSRPRPSRIRRTRSRTCYRSAERARASGVPASHGGRSGRTGWSPQTRQSSRNASFATARALKRATCVFVLAPCESRVGWSSRTSRTRCTSTWFGIRGFERPFNAHQCDTAAFRARIRRLLSGKAGPYGLLLSAGTQPTLRCRSDIWETIGDTTNQLCPRRGQSGLVRHENVVTGEVAERHFWCSACEYFWTITDRRSRPSHPREAKNDARSGDDTDPAADECYSVHMRIR
jgi:hypothetical protein